MSRKYSEAWLDELRDNNEIVSTVGHYVQLTQRGKKHWGLCPFHSEKTPSFSVDAEKQFYYCFGCQAGGNVIHFIMNIEKLGFLEAVELLAERAGMALPEFEESKEEEKKRNHRRRVFSALTESARYYHERLMLPEGEKARSYAARRGMDDRVLVRYGLGYSPLEWTALYDHLKGKGYSDEEMADGGLISTKNNRTFDFFRDRLMFPIIDQYGRVLGFGGRQLEDEGPKYINTSETYVYNKRMMVYGLNFHRSFDDTRELIIVEGYMDLIAIRESGFKNVVASLGTALTTGQARLLRRFADTIFIAYDGDSAGRQATLRGLDILDKNALDVRVIMLPKGLDPDDFIKENGRDAFLKAKEDALTLMEYKLELLKEDFDMSDINGKTEYAKKAAQLANERSPIEAERYFEKIAKDTGFAFETVKEEAKEETEEKPVQRSEVKPQKRVPDISQNTLLAIMATDEKMAEYAFKMIKETDFTEGLHQNMANAIRKQLQAEEFSAAGILQEIEALEEVQKAAGILGQDVDALINTEAVQDLCARVLINYYEQQTDELLKTLMASETEDRNRKAAYIQRNNAIINDLKELKFPRRG